MPFVRVRGVIQSVRQSVSEEGMEGIRDIENTFLHPIQRERREWPLCPSLPSSPSLPFILHALTVPHQPSHYSALLSGQEGQRKNSCNILSGSNLDRQGNGYISPQSRSIIICQRSALHEMWLAVRWPEPETEHAQLQPQLDGWMEQAPPLRREEAE